MDNCGKVDLLRVVEAKFLLTQDNQIMVEYKEPFKAIYEAKHLAQTEAKETERDKKNSPLKKGCLEISAFSGEVIFIGMFCFFNHNEPLETVKKGLLITCCKRD